jgi:4'-phosphopantetheinyl transferase EntD
MLLGIGIDAERNLRLSRRVVERIASEAERETVCELLCTHPQIAWDRLLFSVKEAAYKACYPLGQRDLYFPDVLVELDPSGEFEARLSCVDSRVTGKWLLSDDLLMAAGEIAPNPMPTRSYVHRICPRPGKEG